MNANYEKLIARANSLEDLLEIVRKMMFRLTGRTKKVRLKIENLGFNGKIFLGAHYNYHTNTITINKWPLSTLFEYDKEFFKYYLFHLLLHEYIHSLGVFDERTTRAAVYRVSRHSFGKNHPITIMAEDFSSVIRKLKQIRNKNNTAQIHKLIEHHIRLLEKLFYDF